MTVPGLVEKADDKEKLVVKSDVATIMPNRERLIKIRKRRHVLRLIISLALLLLLLSTIFLTICYIKKIGPFKRIIRGRCPVGTERYGHHKVYESFEITDDYALINVPRFYVKWGTFQSVKTLHVFKKQLTVIQYNGVCFVRPMVKGQGLQRDWFERSSHLSNFDKIPNQFTHIHWQMSHRPFSNEYLRKNVHNMAAAMCLSLPVFHLKFFTFKQNVRRPCYKKCSNCELSKQFVKWEHVNGQYCAVCHCKTQEALKSSNKVDPNCKTIRCENKCNGRKMIGCVQCRCADQDNVARVVSPVIDKIKVDPLIVEESKEHTNSEVPTFQDKSKVLPNHVASSGDARPTPPMFQDLSRQHAIFDQAGIHQRKKRSAELGCKLVAEIIEGYSPLAYDSRMPVDYIHDC